MIGNPTRQIPKITMKLLYTVLAIFVNWKVKYKKVFFQIEQKGKSKRKNKYFYLVFEDIRYTGRTTAKQPTVAIAKNIPGLK